VRCDDRLDPITIEVITEQLIAVVREMRATMIRTAYSMTIHEMKDFSCALFDARRRMVAQSEDLPAHVVPMPWSVEAIMEDFGGDVHPGDVFLMNDAYRGGTHLNDVTMLYPIFAGGELVLLAANRSHWDDVGGMTPGSMSGRATDVFQEGVRIPPIKVIEQGRAVRAALDLLYANMRVPEERQGDFRAMLATCRIAERRVQELLRRYGTAIVLACVDRNIERTTERMRDHIRSVPEGTYYAEDYLEFYHDGVFDPVLLRLALAVKDGTIHCDFTGSSRQVAGVVNASLAVSAAGVVIAVKAFFDPDDPINQGTFAPISFTAPPATVVNAAPLVPCGAHAEIRRRTLSMTVAALARALPDRIAGDMQGTSNHTLIGGIDDRTGRPYVFYEVPVGGSGGFQQHDGPSVFGTVDWADNQPILPAEAIEVDYPLEVVREEIRPDSCGHGQQRGGYGLRLEIRVLSRVASFSLVSDRATVPPYGVFGGVAGAPNEYWIDRAGEVVHLSTPGKASGVLLRANDVVVACTAGGGGYGDPCQREPDLVAAEVALGLLSAVAARRHYGVVVDEAGELDVLATRALREALGDRWPRLRVVTEADSCVGDLGRHRRFRLHPRAARSLDLADGDLAELIGSHPAPLRGWVQAADHAPEGAVMVDEWGQRILGSAEGATVTLRVLRRRQPGDPPLAGSSGPREKGTS
jgi:N-methylhydantoinase B